MANILLLASAGISAVPADFIQWITAYNAQGHKFIVGDSKNSDAVLHRALSSVGAAENTTVYSMGAPNSNVYKFNTVEYLTSYNEELCTVTISGGDLAEPYIIEDVKKEIDIQNNKQWYEFKDRRMIENCSMAIVVASGELSRRVDHIIQILNIRSIPCYVLSI